jgi:hypothetical protein
MNSSEFLYRLNTCIGVSVISALVTHPIDVIKVRTQSNNNTVIKKFSDIVLLSNGMNASILRNTSFVGSKLFAYETIKHHYDLNSFHEKLIAGCVSGAFGCFVGTPFDKIMVQIQHSPKKTTMLSKVREEYRKGGLYEFWKGTKYTFLRTITVTVCQFAVYDEIKQQIMTKTSLNNDFATFFISSVIASSSAAVLSNPFDLCKTRIMNNISNQTIADIIKNEGIRSLSKGTLANVSRQIPLHFVRFSLIEYFNNKFGVKSNV